MFPKLSSQINAWFRPRSILTVSATNAWHNDPPLVYKIRRWGGGGGGGGWGNFQKNWVGACGTLPETLTLFQAKSVIFPTLFET